MGNERATSPLIRRKEDMISKGDLENIATARFIGLRFARKEDSSDLLPPITVMAVVREGVVEQRSQSFDGSIG